MSEASNKLHKKRLPENITELPDKEVAKYLFGKPAAKELDKRIEPKSGDSKEQSK